ncbi:MAG: response regulator [Planctomycetota bacterium]
MIRENIIILVAEDDQGHFILTRNLLRSENINNEIIWLSDGQKTLTRDPQRDYLLLLDIRMPKINGFEVIAKIRSDAALKEIPVIVITTSDFPDNITRCEALGCAGYMIKPLGQDFIKTLKRVASAI